MSAPVLVTGSTGFIGAAVTAALRGAGRDVRAGSRRASPPHSVACDPDDPASLAVAVKETGAVVHCAWGEARTMPRQCAALLAAMSGAGVDILVYFSSIAVYGEHGSSGDTIIDASTLTDPYARAKAECEALVRAWEAAAPGRRAIILRPGIVYGKGSLFWVDKPCARIRAGLWGDFGPLAEGPAPLVHVDDVAKAVLAALDFVKVPRGELPAIDVIGPETPSWNRYFQALATAIHAGPLPRIGKGRLLLWRLCALPARVWRRAGLPGPARMALVPRGGELRLFRRDVSYDRSNIRRIPGALPETGLAEGLVRTFSSFGQSHG